MSTLAGWLQSGIVSAQTSAPPLNDQDLHAYEAATLAQVFSAKPRDPKAATELAPAGQWFRVDVMLTGNKRKPSAAARPLVEQWTNSRGFKPELAEALFEDDFPEVELDEGGKKYWMLVSYSAAMDIYDKLKPQKMVLFVQRIGFVAGKPFPLIILSGTPDEAARALAKPRPPPPPPEPVRKLLAQYQHGEARVLYKGKRYEFPIVPPGSTVGSGGLYEITEYQSKSASIEYCTDKKNCAFVNLFGVDAHDGGPVAIAFWLVLDGKPMDIYPEDDCKLTLKSVTAKLVSGVYNCSAVKGKSPLGKVEFSAR